MTDANKPAVPSDADMVNAAYCLHKYRQGTDNGIAFNRGARWMLAALAQPAPVAAPAPIYQISGAFPADPPNTWRDASEDAYDMHMPDKRRIVYAAPAPASVAAPACAAVEFAVNNSEGLAFLREWMHGDWDAIRKEWPEAPETVFVKP